MKPTISKPFKSNDRTFDKVYNAFDKRDYFDSQGLAKVQIGNFERALKKNDKGAQQILDMFKGDMGKAKDYITQVISDRNKERAFNNYKALKSAVDSIQKGKPQQGAVNYVKRIIHNNNQKYSIALYSTLRNKKFTKWKDVHNDIDSLIGESVNEAYIVLYSPKKGVKPVTTAAYKDKKDAEKWAKDLGGITMIVKKKVKGIDEGKKRYYQQDRVGSAKYTISYHDGKKKHKDGSDFFDIQTFRNKKDLAKFVNTLHKGGYKYGFNESINEGLKFKDVKRGDVLYTSIGSKKGGKQKKEYYKVKILKSISDEPGSERFSAKQLDGLKKGKTVVVFLDTLSKKANESVNENRFLDALKDFFRKEEPTFGQMAKRYKKKSDFIKWFVKSQAKQGVVFKKDGYGAYMMNRMGRIWDRVHGKPEDKKYVGESVNEGISVSDERHFGKKGIIIMIDDNGKKVSAIFKDKKNADKFNRNKPSDIKKLLQLAKKTKFPKAIDESLNEVKEPEVISQLRDIVKRKQNKKIKDPISGKMMRVDLYSASAITQVYDAINKSNKDKFGKLSLPKMVNVAFSVMKKR
jgi:hypothetical protein